MRLRAWSALLLLQVNCGTDSPPADGGEAGQGGAGGGATGGSAGATTGGTTGGNAGSGGSVAGGSGGGGTGAGGSGGTTEGGTAGSTTGGAAGSGAGGGSGGSGGSIGGAGSGGSTGGAFNCSGALFCETFESLADGPAQPTSTWAPMTNNGTLTLDAMHARGARALHVRTMGNGRAYIQTTSFAPPSNSFFGRMYLWVDAFPTAPNYAHYTLVEAAGTGAGLIRMVGGQYVSGNGALWGVGSDGGPTGDWTNWKTSAPAESGKWLCMEWEVQAMDNTVRIWIDGVAKPDLTVSTTMHGGTQVDFVFPTFNRVWFGWWLYQAGPTPNQFDLWMDDIALATTRVGCQ